jgi:hypothetical protein
VAFASIGSDEKVGVVLYYLLVEIRNKYAIH